MSVVPDTMKLEDRNESKFLCLRHTDDRVFQSSCHPQNAIENIQNAAIENVELYSHISGEYPCMIEGNSTVFGEVITIKERH